MTRITLILSLILFGCQNDISSDSDTQSILENNFQFELMADYLQLSQDQIDKINVTRLDYREKSRSKGLRRSGKDMFDALTDEQKEKMIALKKGLHSGDVPFEFVELKKKKMAEFLDLNESQKKSFFDIMDRARSDMKSIRSESKRSKENFDKMKELKDSHKNEMESILSQEQMTKFESIKSVNHKKDHRSKAGKRKHREKVIHDLDLSEEQMRLMKEMKESVKEKMIEIKKADLNKDEKHAKIKQLHEDQKIKLKSILTNEQFEKLEDVRQKKQKRRQRHID